MELNPYMWTRNEWPGCWSGGPHFVSDWTILTLSSDDRCLRADVDQPTSIGDGRYDYINWPAKRLMDQFKSTKGVGHFGRYLHFLLRILNITYGGKSLIKCYFLDAFFRWRTLEIPFLLSRDYVPGLFFVVSFPSCGSTGEQFGVHFCETGSLGCLICMRLLCNFCLLWSVGALPLHLHFSLFVLLSFSHLF